MRAPITERPPTELPTERRSPPGMSRGLTLLFAFAGGAAVANLYWAQPLLTTIADSLQVAPSLAGLLVTVTQIGYALGVFLVVPLGDTANRRRLIPAVMAASALALAASAVAPTFTVLLITLTAVGLTTLTGQMLIPMAGDLARDDQRGSVVATVASGVIVGIQASRTISGLLADTFGWRAIYVVAAIAAVAFAVLLARALPSVPPRAPVPYGQLLRSVFATVRQSRTVQVILIIGALVFAAFTMFWTGLTYLLSAPPFSYSTTQIGLVSLAGLVGALAAQPAGSFYDRGWSVPATGTALTLVLVSLVLAGLGSTSILVVLVAVVLFQGAIQAVNLLNQIRLFAVDANARSRLNTAFVTSNFIGGAIGSTLAGGLWPFGAWWAVMAGGVVLIGVALVVWQLRRSALGIRKCN